MKNLILCFNVKDIILNFMLLILVNRFAELKEDLNYHNLSDLYDIFKREEITSDILWKLKDKELLEMNLKVGQRHRYMEAKKAMMEQFDKDRKNYITYELHRRITYIIHQ